MITDYFEGETDFTKRLAKNPHWFSKLYNACEIESNGEIDPFTEQYTDRGVDKRGRFDIFDSNASTLIEAQLGDLDVDHIHRASDYALGIDQETRYHQADNVIFLIDGYLKNFPKAKVCELNQTERNYFVVSVFPYINSEGVLDLHFTVLLRPEKIKKRVFTKPKDTESSSNFESNFVSDYRPSEPWRSLENLEKIRGEMFYGSVGVGEVKKLGYWIMYVGQGRWVSEGGHHTKSANSCMKQIKLQRYMELYGEPRACNDNAWSHINKNGMTIDNVLKQS